MRARVLGVLLAEENRKWVTLAAVSFGLFMIMLDNTVVNVALPTMEKDLHVTLASLEWVVIAYALTFASLLITGGKLADLYGRRRIFVVGLAIFTLSSLACGLAPSAELPDRSARSAGRRRGAHEPGDALHHRRHLPADGSAGRRSGSGRACRRSRSRSARSAAA